MNLLVLRVLTLLLTIVCTSVAHAGLFFCNNSGQEIAVAVGWREDGVWLSKGWYRIKSRECGAALLGVLKNQRYYYFAESIGGNLEWSGKGESNAGFFCTVQNRFFFRNDNNNCKGSNFKNLWVGDAHQYTVTLNESQTDPAAAALNCRGSANIDSFSKCWMRQVATDRQRRMLDCVQHTRSKASLALCVSKDSLSSDAYKVATCANTYSQNRRGDQFLECIASDSLSDDQAKAFQCAVNHKGDNQAIFACMATSQLSPEQRRVIGCVANNTGYIDAGLCAAGDNIKPEHRRIAGCVMSNKGNYMQMGVCAVGSNLTPEQQVFAQCAVSTGGQPYAFAGCVGGQLTMNELQKCMTDGIGGGGCFGNNNTAVKFVRNAFKDVTEGPGPSNDLLGRDGFIGRKLNDVASDIQHGPGENNDIVGKKGFVCRTLFGGC
jgi:uncharacterized membrane protein